MKRRSVVKCAAKSRPTCELRGRMIQEIACVPLMIVLICSLTILRSVEICGHSWVFFPLVDVSQRQTKHSFL